MNAEKGEQAKFVCVAGLLAFFASNQDLFTLVIDVAQISLLDLRSGTLFGVFGQFPFPHVRPQVLSVKPYRK